MKKLSIGAQNIRDFSVDGLIYVDKTEKVYELMDLGKHNFIVRPRRFGKSLFLDTVAAIYEGKRELFKGTWAYDNIDWEAVIRPVIRIDFTKIGYSSISLEQGLLNHLEPFARELGINSAHREPKDLFASVIQKMGEENPVVILIDEYEMPVTDYVGHDAAKMDENLFTLKKFYGAMKGAGGSIHRSFITGVSKIGKVGILSDLNMLNDLTLDARFTTLFGYTEPELRHYYAEYISAAAAHHGMPEEEMLRHIKLYYNGYSWDGIEANRVYNPFSIVNFFQSFELKNYWFQTGTPTVLVRGARRKMITMADLENLQASAELLEHANLTEFYSLSLLFQAGYLTIKSVRQVGMAKRYSLGFPNREVRDSFAKYLLAEYIGRDWGETEDTVAFRLRVHLEEEQLKEAVQVFAPVIGSTAYDITKHTEGFFHTIMHVLMYSTGLETYSELQSAQGRLDTVCITPRAVYVFEFKLDGTAEGALKQVKKGNYTGRFLGGPKTLYIVGVNFLSAEKRIDKILVEKWDGKRFARVRGDFTPVEGRE